MTFMLRALGAVCPTAFGIDFRVIGRLHRTVDRLDPNRRLRCANGFWMTGDTSNAGYISGVSERSYMRTLAAMMEPEQLVYDVGANVGYLALWLARARGVRVVGFEAAAATAELMRRNAALNPDLQVSVEAIGLGDFNGPARFHTAGAGDGAASMGERHAHGAPVHDVDVTIARLDTYQARSPRAPDWLVIDVEGFGGGVLRGGAETIAALRPRVAAEIHSPQERAEIEAALPGYHVVRELSSIWGRHVIWSPKVIG